MKKLLFLIPIIIILLTGCNSYVELNDLGIIHTIGIEKKDNEFILYASIIKKVKEDGTPISKTYQIKGNNLANIFNNLSLQLNKKIYLSHLDLLMINNSLKTNDLKDIINFFLNNNESRNNFLIVTTENIEESINNSTFQEINNLVKMNEKETSKSIYTTMYDVMNNYYELKPIYLTNIIFNDSITIDGITKIYNNKQENISVNNSIFINYLLNNINTYKINFNCSDNNYLYLNILTSNTNTINNKIIITNEIKVITNDCNLNKQEINNLFNNYLKDNLKQYTSKEINIQNTIRSIYENN